MIDLHCHTTYSDGVCETEDLIREAIAFGLEAIAITDHDNVSSFDLAVAAAKDAPIELIPGIEINTVWVDEDHGIEGQEVHVLGFYIDRQHPALQAVIQNHQCARNTQMQAFAQSLNTTAKLSISYDALRNSPTAKGSLGRPHLAAEIVRQGGAKDIGEAFQKYLKRHCHGYVKRKTVSPHDAVEAIYESGGIPVIAHPGDMPKLETLVIELMDYGLRGLEAYHKSHHPGLIEYHCTLAEKHGLIVTGGTDYHGAAEGYQHALKRLHTPAYVYTELKAERDRRKRASFKVS